MSSDIPDAIPGDGVIAVAGEALIDLLPAVGADRGLFQATPGGSPANVAIGLTRLGVPTRMVARLAEDPLGRRLRTHLTDNNVDLRHATTALEPTSLAIITIGTDGAADYDFRIDGTADWQWTDAELATALQPGPDGEVVALHTGSLALTRSPGAAPLRRLMARARDTATVSYDPNCRPQLMGNPASMLEEVHAALTLADVVKVSSEDLAWLLPGQRPETVIADWLHRGPAQVIVTLGPEGVIAGNSAAIRRRIGRAVTVVDTVGAGDAFSAGFLAGLHRRGLLGAAARPALAALPERDLDALLDEALDIAALTCTRRGADPPTYSEWQAHHDRTAGAQYHCSRGTRGGVTAARRPVVTDS